MVYQFTNELKIDQSISKQGDPSAAARSGKRKLIEWYEKSLLEGD